MRRPRRALMWGTLGALLILIVLSVAGAFVGADRAQEAFGSRACLVLWIALGALFAVCLAVSPRPLRAPGLFALHLAPLLILLGGFFGSEMGHRMLERFRGRPKVPAGFVMLHEGETSDLLIDETGLVLGRLPFALRLEDFRILYYEGQPWHLLAALPPEQPGGDPRVVELEWSFGREITVPATDVSLRVLSYEPRARLVYGAGGGPRLEVALPGGPVRTLPARPGEVLPLESPPVTLKVARVFSSLSVRVTPWGPEAYDAVGGAAAPALLIEAARGDGEAAAVYVGPEGIIHAGREDLPPMRYVVPEPVAVASDPDSPVPGMAIEIITEARPVRTLLVPDPQRGLVRVPLEPPEEYPALFLARGDQAARQYESEVTVIEEGAPVERAVIGVNSPVRHGGYRLYQHSYDAAGATYTVLRATSDSGLPLIWAGYVLLGAGVCWVCWLLPGLRRPGRGAADGY